MKAISYECNCNSNSYNDIHIASLIEQIHLKEEDKMQNSIILSLVLQNPFTTVHNDLFCS